MKNRMEKKKKSRDIGGGSETKRRFLGRVNVHQTATDGCYHPTPITLSQST